MPAPASIQAPEVPLFFESHGHPLWGVYHPAAEPRDRPVVIHVHGLGVEQITTYRTEVLTARALAAAGTPVFRYHARGHGDSSGDFAAVTLETMTEDACAAADEARRLSGAARVLWLGVRFGGFAAAAATARRADTAGLALWDPVHHGFDYFRGLLRAMLFSQVAAGIKPDMNVDQLLAAVERDGHVDVHGYFLHRAIFESARDVKLADLLAAWSGPTLLAQLQGRGRLSGPNEALLAGVQSRGGTIRTYLHREDIAWHYTQNPAWECPPLTDATREWADAVA